MLYQIQSLFLLAQDTPSTGSAFGSMLIPMIAIGVLFYFMIWRPEKKKQAEHQERLGALKKNETIVTIGGIYGTVVNVPNDKDYIMIRVDDSTNTRMRVSRAAVSKVITQEDQQAGSEEK